MQILIEYDSSWRMGFLGDDEKKTISNVKNQMNKPSDTGFMQKFIATSKAKGQRECDVTKSTVLGILCRLIGDQRKLFQVRKSSNYYFSDIEEHISFKDIIQYRDSELIYLTNKSDDRCGQGNWMGVLSDENPWFSSPVSEQFWSVLFLNKMEIVDFILSGKSNNNKNLNILNSNKPINLIDRINNITDIKNELGSPWLSVEQLKKNREKIENKIMAEKDKITSLEAKFSLKKSKTEKQVKTHENKLKIYQASIAEMMKELDDLGTIEQCKAQQDKLNQAITLILGEYPNNEYWKGDSLLYPYRLYSAALYLQAKRLILDGANLDFMLNKKEEIQIQGFSPRGFNGIRDWLNPMTGKRKKAVGTPCNIQKQSGILEIEINLDSDAQGLYFQDMTRSQEINQLIENAGVSSFYLGKKGLAYVSKIRL